ncbi:hypothetical protein TorRG33x02_287600 [Trema orientale]|uniref:Zinc finger, CCHC-type n=1 Tax=Trema orientale TaxID=63057 RepID=A0A2P5CF35_TREOI|nr:hypothetical protein TorRG33x02_287600 [Trema orientale]
MVITMTHSGNIRTFDDLSRHLKLVAEHLEAAKPIKDSNPGSAYVANNQRGPIVAKRKNQAPRGDSGNGPAPKKAKATRRKRGKRDGKGKNGRCYNCDKEGHFV